MNTDQRIFIAIASRTLANLFGIVRLVSVVIMAVSVVDTNRRRGGCFRAFNFHSRRRICSESHEYHSASRLAIVFFTVLYWLANAMRCIGRPEKRDYNMFRIRESETLCVEKLLSLSEFMGPSKVRL